VRVCDKNVKYKIWRLLCAEECPFCGLPCCCCYFALTPSLSLSLLLTYSFSLPLFLVYYLYLVDVVVLVFCQFNGPARRSERRRSKRIGFLCSFVLATKSPPLPLILCWPHPLPSTHQLLWLPLCFGQFCLSAAASGVLLAVCHAVGGEFIIWPTEKQQQDKG